MGEPHKCVLGWAYCEGNCSACAASNYYTTNGTITLSPTEKGYLSYMDYPKERKKQTNADRIRNMSDEELAKMFLEHDEQICRHCPNDLLAQYCRQVIPASARRECDKCWLDWLKKEV